VPAAAVVWRNADALVFRAVAENKFEPVPIATGSSIKGGYFVASGLKPGERVVVRGAGLLLGAAATTGSAPGNEDD
jgi:cobalt-zinc-cadmium efflux system membrane fusion protein